MELLILTRINRWLEDTKSRKLPDNYLISTVRLTYLAVLDIISIMSEPQDFSNYLKLAREKKGFSLREVERATEISNAYLSQLEQGKIRQPSPNVLYTLCQFYEISYADALRLVGYPVPDEVEDRKSVSRLSSRIGPISEEEEDALIEYLEFIRSRQKSGGASR